MSEQEQQRFEALLEQVLDQVKVVAEGHGMLSAKIDSVRFDLSERMDLLAAKIGMVHHKLDAQINTVHDKLDAKIDAVHDKLEAQINTVHDTLDAKIDVVHEDLKSEIRAVAEAGESHGKRLDTLERKAG